MQQIIIDGNGVFLSVVGFLLTGMIGVITTRALRAFDELDRRLIGVLDEVDLVKGRVAKIVTLHQVHHPKESFV